MSLKRDSASKEADWQAVRNKAKSIVDSGGVNIIRHDTEIIAGVVQSTTGKTYNPVLERQDPDSMSVTVWTCDCDWETYSWARSGPWKKYEGRMCSHATALLYAAQKEEVPGWKSPDARQFEGKVANSNYYYHGVKAGRIDAIRREGIKGFSAFDRWGEGYSTTPLIWLTDEFDTAYRFARNGGEILRVPMETVKAKYECEAEYSCKGVIAPSMLEIYDWDTKMWNPLTRTAKVAAKNLDGITFKVNEHRNGIDAFDGAYRCGGIKFFTPFPNSVNPENVISNISVEGGYRNRGIATELFRRARELSGSTPLVHDDKYTDDAHGWIQSLPSDWQTERSAKKDKFYLHFRLEDEWGWEGPYALVEEAQEAAKVLQQWNGITYAEIKQVPSDFVPPAKGAGRTANVQIKQTYLPADNWQEVEASINGEPVGWLTVQWNDYGDGIYGTIIAIEVVEEHRRKGIATQMLEAVRKAFPDRDIEHSEEHLTDDGAEWADVVGSKTAKTFYHVCSEGALNSIMAEGINTVPGLHGGMQNFPGMYNVVANYLWEDMADAQEWADYWWQYKKTQTYIIEVNTDGRKVKQDRVMSDAYYVTERIPANNIVKVWTPTDYSYNESLMYEPWKAAKPKLLEKTEQPGKCPTCEKPVRDVLRHIMEVHMGYGAHDHNGDDVIDHYASKISMPSWRGYTQEDWWNDYDAVIASDSGSRMSNFEVWTFGEQIARHFYLDDAKSEVEDIYGKLDWEKIVLPRVKVKHPTLGETEEFTEAKTIYVVRKLPKL